MADLAYGFDVSTSTIKKLDQKYLQNNLSLQRKKRSDASSNLISSESKRQKLSNPVQLFKATLPQPPKNKQLLQNEWQATPAEIKQQFTEKSEEILHRRRHLEGDLAALLKTTNGGLSWAEIAKRINGDGDKIVSASTVRRFILNLPDTRYVHTTV